MAGPWCAVGRRTSYAACSQLLVTAMTSDAMETSVRPSGQSDCSPPPRLIKGGQADGWLQVQQLAGRGCRGVQRLRAAVDLGDDAGADPDVIKGLGDCTRVNLCAD